MVSSYKKAAASVHADEGADPVGVIAESVVVLVVVVVGGAAPVGVLACPPHPSTQSAAPRTPLRMLAQYFLI